MSSTFKLISQDCGLTMTEAASFLDVRPDTAKSWWMGRRTCPDSVVDEILTLAIRQDVAAQEAALVITEAVERQGAPEDIELGIAADDYEAQSIGWPCVGAHAAVIRKLIKMLPSALVVLVKIVPRGSTLATAAAEIKT